MAPEERRNAENSDSRVVVQIHVPGDNNVIFLGDITNEIAAVRPTPRRLRKRTWRRVWMWLVKLADRIAVAGHFLGAAVIALLGPLGGA
jgi:hypothetical protein